MIQIYKPGTSLEANGDIVLTPSECLLTARLNEVWVLEMTHPMDEEGRWEYLVEEGILKVPTWQDDEQLYRITQLEKTDNEVKVTAYPIFMDARNQVFIQDLTVSGTGQTALNQMLALGPAQNGTPIYMAVSDLPTARRATFQLRNFIDCLNGSGDPTFIGLWGGEIVFDNMTIHVKQRIGSDRDVYVRYGRNITGVEYNIDCSEICTRIYPVAYGGYPINSGQAYVDSPLINTYDVLYIKHVVFDNIRLLEDIPDSEDSVNYIVCSDRTQMDAYLRQACEDMFDEGCDTPKISMKVNLIDLSLTEQYKDFADLEKISLGDTVHCVHEKLGVEADARVVGVVWDCAMDRIQTVELDNFLYDYLRDTFKDTASILNRVAGITDASGNVMAERVRGFLDATQAKIHTIRTSATDAHVMGVFFEDKVQGSATYGALGIGTQGLMIADEWDNTTNDWKWQTAITAEGVLSPMIVTQALSGVDATNWWDLQLGQISFQTISNDVDSRIATATANSISGLTGLEICNKIFQGGQIQGFQTRTVNGVTKFYLSFDSFIGGSGLLGGLSNGNGILIIQNASGNEIVRLDNNGIIAKNTSGYTVFKTTTTGAEIWDGAGHALAKFNSSGISMYSSSGTLLARFSPTKFFYEDENGNITQFRNGIIEYIRDDGVLYEGEILPHSYIDFEANYSGEICMVIGTRYDGVKVQGAYIAFDSGPANDGSSTTRMSITSSAINHYLPVSGASDRRLKENLEICKQDCEFQMNRIPIRAYDWRNSGKHVSAGIIAQELQTILPELVIKDEATGYLGINYDGLVPFLIKAVQEQSTRITHLETLVKSLSSKEV